MIKFNIFDRIIKAKCKIWQRAHFIISNFLLAVPLGGEREVKWMKESFIKNNDLKL